jgi:hypothetical protein
VTSYDPVDDVSAKMDELLAKAAALGPGFSARLQPSVVTEWPELRITAL